MRPWMKDNRRPSHCPAKKETLQVRTFFLDRTFTLYRGSSSWLNPPVHEIPMALSSPNSITCR